MKNETNHGGKRRGAGRPVSGRRRMEVQLNEETIQKIKDLAAGTKKTPGQIIEEKFKTV